MSIPAVARFRPKRRILLIRRSTWLIRSEYIDRGSIRLTVTLGAFPDRLRPSDGKTTALVATYCAVISGPGRFCTDALIWTPMRGTVYAPSSLTWVRKVP